MPLYDFLCLSCKKQYTYLTMTFGEDKGAVCTHCGSKKKEKIISKVNVWKRGSKDDSDDFGGDDDFAGDGGMDGDDDFGGDDDYGDDGLGGDDDMGGDDDFSGSSDED